MTAEEFERAMTEIKRSFYHTGDKEKAHGLADDLLCKILLEAGYTGGVGVYKTMEKWYA